MPKYTAIVTLLAVAFYFFIATRVAVAHRTYGVQLPAMNGNAGFERVHRAHMNMVEWAPVFFPSLWLCALYLHDATAAALGFVWIAGRYLYYTGYVQAVEKRIPGFAIQAGASALLFVGAAAGVVMRW